MEFALGNIFIREMRGEKTGDEMTPGHKHNFPHATYVISGRIRIEATSPEGRVVVLEKSAGQRLLIHPEWTHRIVALEDNTRADCIYSHRDPQSGEVVQEYDLSYPGAYV